MAQQRSKSFDKTIKVTDLGAGATHGVRHTQKEYKSSKKKTVQVAETFCGRKREGQGKPGKVTCFACIKAMASKARKK